MTGIFQGGWILANFNNNTKITVWELEYWYAYSSVLSTDLYWLSSVYSSAAHGNPDIITVRNVISSWLWCI